MQIKLIMEDESEEICFKEAIDHLKAGCYINQIDDIEDFATAKNIYFNKFCVENVGYTPHEAEALKEEFFQLIMHPDDINLAVKSLIYLKEHPNSDFSGVSRLISKNGEIVWCYVSTSVYKTRNNVPWQFISIFFNVAEHMKTEIQLVELLKENTALKNEFKLSSLTKREKQIIPLIVSGKTDYDISNQLFISVHTAKTHRKNILHKLDLSRSSDLVRFALENGLH
jgi:PAS domain S-box-containing protein